MPTYTLLATQVPTVQVPAAYLDPADMTPGAAEAITSGETDTGLDKVNRNAARLDLLSQVGAGGPYGVQQGTGELTAGSGLTCNISAAAYRIDGVDYADAQTFACSAGSNYLWLNASGAVVRSATTAVPSGGRVYLGHVLCSGGSIISIDYSGRHELRSGLLFRVTADEAEPEDEPDASISFFALTNAGLYLWDGDAYQPLTGGTTVLENTLSTVETEAEELRRDFRRLLVKLVQSPLGTSILDDQLLTPFAIGLAEV